MQSASPPLLITSAVPLSKADRVEFEAHFKGFGGIQDEQVCVCPFPVAVYHRFDGVWIPASDLGAFHSPSPAPAPVDMACNDADD